MNIKYKNSSNKYNKNRSYLYVKFYWILINYLIPSILTITKTRGCSYYRDKSPKDFALKMDNQEFEYMVTPLVFDVILELNVECGIA